MRPQLVEESASEQAQNTAGTKDTSGVTGSVTPMDSLKTVLGSREGASLRRIARDVDSLEVILKLASP